MKLDCMQISSTRFYMQSKKAKKEKIIFFSTSMAYIDKILKMKPKINAKTIIPEQYWDYLNVFNENEANQLPPIRGPGINHQKQGFLKLLPIPNRIWSEISIDFVVDFPENEKCKNILIIIDKLSKRKILEFCNSMDAEIVAEIFIRKFYRQHGLPTVIISDRNRQFVNILWKKICSIFCIQRKFSTVYHPQIDGTTEKMNQIMGTFLRTYIDFDQRNWVKLLYITKFVINNKDAASARINIFFMDITPKFWKLTKNCERAMKNLSKKLMG